MDDGSLSRRDFLGAAAAGAALAAVPAQAAPAVRTMREAPFAARAAVRVGLVGVGARGQSLLADLLRIPAVEVRAVADIDPARLAEAERRCLAAGREAPVAHGRGERDYERLCRREDLDLVLVATPWEWHAPMALCALAEGRHVGVEVPAATTVEELWDLVRASERHRRHCVILENCCYGENELMALAMVEAGLLGTLTHAEAAYIHDLRGVMNERGADGAYRSEAKWRRAWHGRRDGNLYPTHGLGPVCRYFGVHRGDRLETLVSLSSLEASLGEDQAARFPGRGETYRCGDMNTSILRTAKGRTILLQHDVVTPRPYTRHNLLQGTRGAFADFPARLFLDAEAKRSGSHRWLQGDDLAPWRARFTHPLWQRVGGQAKAGGGHGGMDFVMLWRLVECMREGLPPDLDVYDAAAWSAPFPLSVASVRQRGLPQPVPDFTRGHWGGPVHRNGNG